MPELVFVAFIVLLLPMKVLQFLNTMTIGPLIRLIFSKTTFNLPHATNKRPLGWLLPIHGWLIAQINYIKPIS